MANYLGFYAVLTPISAAVAALTYLVVFALVRVPFIGSFGMVAVLTVSGLIRWGDTMVGAAALVITALCIIWFHRSNIAAFVDSRRKGRGN